MNARRDNPGCELSRWTRVRRALAGLALLAGVAALRADIVMPVPTAADSEATIRVSTPTASLPRFGFAPVRVSIENAAAHERTWSVGIQAGMRSQFPGVSTTERTITVPAGQTRETWIFIPLAEPSTGAAHVIAPGGASPVAASGAIVPLVTVTKTATGTRVVRVFPSPRGGSPLSTVTTDIDTRTGVMTETRTTAGGASGTQTFTPRPGDDVTIRIDPATGSISRSGTSSPSGAAGLTAGPRSVRIVMTPGSGPGGSGRAFNPAVTITRTPLGTKVTRVVGRLTTEREIDATTGEITTVMMSAGGTTSPPSTSPPPPPGTETVYTIDAGSGIIRTSTHITGTPTAPPKITIVTAAVPGGGTGSAPVPGPAGAPLISTAQIFPTVINVEISGPGVAGTSRTMLPNAGAGNSQMRPFAVSAALEPGIRLELSTVVRGAPNLSPVDPRQLPADWRVWSSFAAVILKSDEYNELDAGRRAALRGWVGLGGRLWLSPSAPGRERVEQVGAGFIATPAEPLAFSREGGATDQATADLWVGKIQVYGGTPGLPDRGALSLEKSLIGESVQDPATANTWLAIFLIGFAIVVGPVNLFVFAPVSKRHRLFVTTPVIALAAAVVLMVTILTQDGLGGTGMRRALVVLLPGENEAAVFQEQASRTGFLARRTFALDDETQMTALEIDAPDPRMNFNAAGTELARTDGRASGDWFRSRERQAQLLQRLVPTRGRVERVGTAPGGAPIVQSSLGTTLQSFTCVDAAGALWTAPELPPGKRVTLAPGGTWIGATVLGGSHRLTEVLDAAAPQAPGRWGAHGGASDLAPIATLDSVRWTDAGVVYTGILEGGEAKP